MSIIDDFLSHYVREIEFYKRLANAGAERCQKILDERNIQAIVTSRAKRLDRLREKLEKRHAKRSYSSLDDIYTDIPDLAGVRIALYFPKERATVDRLLRDSFDVSQVKIFPERLSDNSSVSSSSTPDTIKSRFLGYAATHYRVVFRIEHLGSVDAHLAGNRFEIQVASVLMHGWSEVEHDLAYKPQTGDLSGAERALLDQVNGLVHAGEIALEQLQVARDLRLGKADQPFEHHTELGRFLYLTIRRVFPDLERDPVLGRVDILLDFLTKTNQNRPVAIQGLVAELSPQHDRLPIVDQIVDLLTLGNPDLYEKYSESRQRMFAENPYRGLDYHRTEPSTWGSETRFLQLWILFERCIRDVSGVGQGQRRPFTDLVNDAFFHVRLEGDQPYISDEEQYKLRRARNLRNRIVHGFDVDENIDFEDASSLLRELLRRLRHAVSEPLQRAIDEVTANG
jgi:ppGpp synthetase/RelA/SpoT-type nucleotidyltranferase